MKRIAIALTLALSITLPLASTAAAQDPDDFTEYDFEDDLVHGDLVRPDGELVASARRWEHMSLIRVRDNFINELLFSIAML